MKISVIMFAIICAYAVVSHGLCDESIYYKVPPSYTINLKPSQSISSPTGPQANPESGPISQNQEVNANFVGESDTFLHVDKKVNPNYKEFYLLNKIYCLNVDIAGVGRSLNDILIKEKVDPNLIMDLSKPFVAISDEFDNASDRTVFEVKDNVTEIRSTAA